MNNKQKYKQHCPVKMGKSDRMDYQYEHNGIVNVPIFIEQLNLHRVVSVMEGKADVELPYKIKLRLEMYYEYI